MKHNYGMIHLSLTHPQVRKLHKGERIQLKHDQIGTGMPIHLHATKVRKLHTAHRNNKGLRMTMSPEEVDLNGEGLGKILGKVGSFFKNTVAPIYHQDVAPAVRQGIKTAVRAGVSALGDSVGSLIGDPALGSMAASAIGNLTDKGVDYVGNTTGAFGLKHRKFHVKSDFSPFITSMHPAMRPHLALPDFSKPDYQHSGGRLIVQAGHPITRGGSFLPA